MTLINAITSKYRTWQENRFLKKHGCETREQYDYRYDPDRVPRATQIRNYYQGYQHVHCFENRENFVYKIIYDYGPGGYRDGFDEIYEWCEENLSGKWRYDMLRVMKWPSTGNQWEINELGGGDHWFFAFQNDEDYFMFKLQWGQ
jgi:hypothetical protein